MRSHLVFPEMVAVPTERIHAPSILSLSHIYERGASYLGVRTRSNCDYEEIVISQQRSIKISHETC